MKNEEVLQKYRGYLTARRSSLTYFYCMSSLLAFLENNNLDYNNLSQQDLTDFLNHDKYSANSINTIIRAGRSFYRFLGLSDEKNAFYSIKNVRIPKKRPEYISEEELKGLSKHLSDKLFLVISFMYYTGIRRGELLTLRRQNIDLISNPSVIKVLGKGDKERFIYISDKFSPNLRRKIAEYFRTEKQQSNAFNISLSQLNYLCRRLNKYSSDKHIHPHLFRHSFAKTMMSKGLPITYLSNLLGHSNITTTQVYVNPTDELIKAYF